MADNTFEKLQEEYKALRVELQRNMLTRFPNEGNSTIGLTSSNNASSQRSITKVQPNPPEVRVLKHQIAELKLVLQMTNDLEVRKSIGLATAQLDNIKTLWSELRATHRTVSMSDNNQYCELMQINQLQATYLKVCGKLGEIIKSKNDKANVILPKLKLPEFDGSSSWICLMKLFTTTQICQME